MNNIEKVIEIARRDGRYTSSAYLFVNTAVERTIDALPRHRHISALELLRGVRKQAQNVYGKFAGIFFKSVGINNARDVGEIVFQLVACGILSVSEEDSQADFEIDFPLVEPPTESAPTLLKKPILDANTKYHKNKTI